MSKLSDVLLQGIRADQPLATDVAEASLYFVTDEEVTEQSLSGSWEPYSPTSSGTGTVTNTGTLTDHALIVGNGGVDVSALGSLGTTTTVLHGNAAADPAFSAVVEADITLADNTTNDVTSTKHGFTPKSPGTNTTFLNGGATPAFSTPDAANIPLSSQSLQSFVAQITNTAGTLQGLVKAQTGDATAASYASKIVNQSASLTNLPTVSSGVDFSANGLGITSNIYVFNTAAQTIANYFGTVAVEYYDGNVASQTPRAYAGFFSRDVNGTTRIRLEIYVINALSGAAWTLNTTNLPSGKSILIRWTGYLA